MDRDPFPQPINPYGIRNRSSHHEISLDSTGTSSRHPIPFRSHPSHRPVKYHTGSPPRLQNHTFSPTQLHPSMFENIVHPPLGSRQQLPARPFGPLTTSNIIDIRTDTNESHLRQSLLETIQAACHGQAAMPDLLLWDEQGLRYFEDVTFSPAYYLTNEEIGLLEKHKYQIAQHIPSGSIVVELGSG